MDTVRQWVLTVTVSAAAGAVILLLTPGGGLSKSVRTAVSLFLVLSMLSPFMNGINIDFSELNFDSGGEISDLSNTIKTQMEVSLRNESEKILRESGINFRGVNIDITVKDEEMTVEKITVELYDENDGEKVKALFKSRLEVEVQTEVVQ